MDGRKPAKNNKETKHANTQKTRSRRLGDKGKDTCEDASKMNTARGWPESHQRVTRPGPNAMAEHPYQLGLIQNNIMSHTYDQAI